MHKIASDADASVQRPGQIDVFKSVTDLMYNNLVTKNRDDVFNKGLNKCNSLSMGDGPLDLLIVHHKNPICIKTLHLIVLTHC